jgi:parallel beta-helix repeat protein
MNDLPRQKLREIVARHGRTVIEDARRCEGLLRDYCSKYRREISVLVMALEERVAEDMLAATASTTPREVLLARLSERLCDHLALAEPAARWAVDSWALALGLISIGELQSIEQRRQAQSESTQLPATTQPPATTQNTKQQAHVTSRATGAAAASVTNVIVSAKDDGDYASISEALKNAAPGARLIVRPGTYSEGIIIDKRIEIIGEGLPEDIIIRSVDSSCIQMRADRAAVKGLTLKGRTRSGGAGFFAVDIAQGELHLDNCDISSDTLSCVAVHGSTAAPVITRCRIHDGADSGIYFFDGAAGTIEDCEVYGNANVGVAITDNANPNVKRCKIRQGRNAGVVVWKDGAGLIEACEIYGNRLAGIGISEGGNPLVRACRLYEGDNSGIFVHAAGAGTIERCDISGHREAEVAITTRGNLILRECRIHSGQNSGVFIREEGQALLQSCGIYSNADSGVVVDSTALAAIRACHIKGNGQVAIKILEGGTLSVEDSDLTGNSLGSWDAEDGAFIEEARNLEE